MYYSYLYIMNCTLNYYGLYEIIYEFLWHTSYKNCSYVTAFLSMSLYQIPAFIPQIVAIPISNSNPPHRFIKSFQFPPQIRRIQFSNPYDLLPRSTQSKKKETEGWQPHSHGPAPLPFSRRRGAQHRQVAKARLLPD
jgi:hypothetical protein